MSIIDAPLTTLKVDAPVREVLVGAFWTAVVLEGDPLPGKWLLTMMH